MRALVLGGYGAVGRIVVQQLRANGDTAYAAGRDPARADRVLDLRAGAHRAYLEALDDVDTVVNASGAEDPDLVVAATDRGVAFVDITATTSYAAALAQLEPAAPVLYDVGLAPGLTSILATALHNDSAAPGPIDIALIIGAGERHGPAATEWAYSLLGQFFPDTHGGPQVRNYTRPRTFDLPRMGKRRLYRTDYCDQHLLTQRLGVPVRTYFALDSRPSTASLALLTRIPGAARIAPRRLRLPGSDQWLVAAFGSDPASPVGPRPLRIVSHRYGRSAGRPCRDRTGSRRPSTLEHPRPHGHCRHRDDPPRPVTPPAHRRTAGHRIRSDAEPSTVIYNRSLLISTKERW